MQRLPARERLYLLLLEQLVPVAAGAARDRGFGSG